MSAPEIPEILLPIVFTIITIASILILYWLLPQGNMIKCASQICSSYDKDCNKHHVCGKECVKDSNPNRCGTPKIHINSVPGFGLIEKAITHYKNSKNSYEKLHNKGGPGPRLLNS